MTLGPGEWTSAIRKHARAKGLELPGDVIEELSVHLDELYAHAVDQGRSADEARAATMAAIESATLPELEHRRRARPQAQSRLLGRASMNPGVLTGVGFDIRYALRLLRRQPLFACAVIGLLALSIGAAGAIFSVVDSVLLHPLPYPDADRLVVLTRIDKAGRQGAMSSADWLDYAQRVEAFEGVAAHASWTHNLSGDGEPLRLRSILASGNFFSVLGVPPAIGRTFTDADDRDDAPAVVVLSDGLWTRRFGRDPGVLGRAILLNGRPVSIIGVMPPSFQYPSNAVDLWTPFGVPAEVRADRASEWLSALARVRPGVSTETATGQTQALAAALAEAYPVTNTGENAALVPLLDSIVGAVRPALLVVAGSVIFVFLITCLNAANLLLARASVRQDEMAVRLAIGANRWRLVRQGLAETAILTAGAAICGAGVAWGLLQGIVLLGTERIPRLAGAGLHGTSLAVAAMACGIVMACCAVAATLALGRSRGHALTPGGVRLARSQGLRPILLAIEIACSFVLVTAALLLAGSYARLQQVPAGFDTTDVLSLRIALARQQYPDNAAHVRFADAVERELSGVPGVTAAGVINDLPFGGNQMSFPIALDRAEPHTGPPLRATMRLTSPGYFEVLKIPVLAGRAVSTEDVTGREPVAVVNRAAAERYWPGGAFGQRVQVGDNDGWRRIVGVVADIRHAGFETDEGPVVYIPYAQKAFTFVNWIGILVRGPSVATVARSVKARIAAIDPAQPLYDVMLLDDYIVRARAPYRLNSWIVGCLAALAMLLAVAGVFALTSYMVAARRQEFGIRLALGSSQGSVLRLVLGQVLKVVVAGTIAGAAAALPAARWLSALLFQMTPDDPRVFAAVAALFILAALGAALAPALAAARLDPASTIRAE